jgi:hypothetical protein
VKKLQELFRTINKETEVTEAIQKLLLIQKMEFIIKGEGDKLLRLMKITQGTTVPPTDEEPCVREKKFASISMMHNFLSKHREYIFEYAVLQLRLITKETKNMQCLDSSRLLCLIRTVNRCKEMIGDIIVNHRMTKTIESNWETTLKARKPYFCWPPNTTG